MFDHWPTLVLGLGTGFVFGFLLQKGGVTRYEIIVRQFLLQDFTVLKTMLTAIVVGGWGFWFLTAQGLAEPAIKPAILVANISGGLVFGVGMVLLGLCPGTAVTALGEGNRRAFAGVLGMLAGAVLQAETYNGIAAKVRRIDLGPLTLPALLQLSPVIVLSVLTIASILLFVALETAARRQAGHP